MAIRTCDGFYLNDAGNGTGLIVKKIDGEEFGDRVTLGNKIKFLREERKHVEHSDTNPSAFKASKSNVGIEYKVAAGTAYTNPIYPNMKPS